MRESKFLFLFLSAFFLFILTGCNDENNTDDFNVVNFDSFKVVSVAEKYDNGNFSGESENVEELGETDSKSIVDIVDETFTRNEDYDYIETNRSYSISFDLSSSISLTSNDSSDILGRNFYVDTVKINGQTVEYKIKNGKLILMWKSPEEASNEDIAVIIEGHNSKGEKLTQTGKIKSNVNDKQYEIVVVNLNSYTDKFIMDIDVTKHNNGKGGTLYFLLSDGVSIIREIELIEGRNSLELTGLDMGQLYEYIIVNKHSSDSINSSICFGELISLLPYQITFDSITSNSVSIFLNPKGKESYVGISGVYVYDGNVLAAYPKEMFARTYKFENLEPNHEYVVRIVYYDYLTEKSKFFTKKFRTLDTDEVLVGMMPNISNEVSTWSNGTKVEIKTSNLKYENIYLKKGSVSCDKEGNVVTDGYYVKITLPYDSFVNVAITSSNNSDVYTRSAYITNGIDYCRLKVSSYTSDKNIQSYFFKKGEYYIYTNDAGIFLYDLTIDAVMKKTVDSNIYDESNVTYLVEEKDQTMFFVGKQFDFSNFSVKKIYRTKDGDFYKNVDNFKVNLLNVNDFSNTVTVSSNDIVTELHKSYLIIDSFVFDDEVVKKFANVKVFDENIEFMIDYFDEKNNSCCFLVNEEFDPTGKGFEIVACQKIGENTYTVVDTYKKIYLDDLNDGWYVSFSNGLSSEEAVYGSIYSLDTSKETNNGRIYVSFDGYKDKNIGKLLEIGINYKVTNLTISEPIIYSDKTTFMDKIDDLSSYAKIRTNYCDKLEYKRLKELADNGVGGLSDVRLAYYETDSNELIDINNIDLGTYKAVLLINGEIVTNPIEITFKEGKTIPSYNGVAAKSESYDVWDITGEYLKVAANPNEGGEATAGVQMRAFTSEATITSREFDSANTATIIIMAGTNSSSKEARLLIELLDANGNPVEIAVLNGHPYSYEELDVDGNLSTIYPTGIYEIVSNNKITTKTVFDISTKEEFVKIRISNITCGSNKKVAIVSIDAVVA